MTTRKRRSARRPIPRPARKTPPTIAGYRELYHPRLEQDGRPVTHLINHDRRTVTFRSTIKTLPEIRTLMRGLVRIEIEEYVQVRDRLVAAAKDYDRYLQMLPPRSRA